MVHVRCKNAFGFLMILDISSMSKIIRIWIPYDLKVGGIGL